MVDEIFVSGGLHQDWLYELMHYAVYGYFMPIALVAIICIIIDFFGYLLSRLSLAIFYFFFFVIFTFFSGNIRLLRNSIFNVIAYENTGLISAIVADTVLSILIAFVFLAILYIAFMLASKLFCYLMDIKYRLTLKAITERDTRTLGKLLTHNISYQLDEKRIIEIINATDDDQSMLYSIAKKLILPDSFRIKLAYKLTDEASADEIFYDVLNTSSCYDIRKFAIARILNQSILEEYAISGDDETLCAEAIVGISNQDSLHKIASSAATECIRKKALAKISYNDKAEEIALSDTK